MLRRRHGSASWSDAPVVTASGSIPLKAAGVTTVARADVAMIPRRFSKARFVTRGTSARARLWRDRPQQALRRIKALPNMRPAPPQRCRLVCLERALGRSATGAARIRYALRERQTIEKSIRKSGTDHWRGNVRRVSGNRDPAVAHPGW
jgi:hypothetical protein